MRKVPKSVGALLRWMAVLPGSILALVLSQFILHLVLYQTLTGSGIVEPYPEASERLFGPLAATFACVWVAPQIAPSRKTETAVGTFAVMMLCIGASLALALSGARFGNVGYFVRMGGLPVAGGVVGAFLGLYLAHRQKLESMKLG